MPSEIEELKQQLQELKRENLDTRSITRIDRALDRQAPGIPDVLREVAHRRLKAQISDKGSDAGAAVSAFLGDSAIKGALSGYAASAAPEPAAAPAQQQPSGKTPLSQMMEELASGASKFKMAK